MSIQPSSSRDIPSSEHTTPPRRSSRKSRGSENIHEKINPIRPTSTKLDRKIEPRKPGDTPPVTASSSQITTSRKKIDILMNQWNNYSKRGDTPILYYSIREDIFCCGNTNFVSDKISKLFTFDEFEVANLLLKKYELKDEDKTALLEFTKRLFDHKGVYIEKLNQESRNGEKEWRELVWDLSPTSWKKTMEAAGHPEWKFHHGR